MNMKTVVGTVNKGKALVVIVVKLRERSYPALILTILSVPCFRFQTDESVTELQVVGNKL